MKHHLPSIESLKVFEAAARHLSFSLAAEELCISKGAVSYQIRKLEAQLDCVLFRRYIRQVYLTEAGQTLLITTQSVFEQLTHTLQQMQNGSAAHDVSVAVTTYVAVRWLSSRVASFNEHHPDVSVILKHSVNSEDFKLRDVDIAIRWCRCDGRPDPNRILEMPMPLFPAVSTALLQRMGLASDSRLPQSLLQQHPYDQIPLLSEDRTLDLWQTWYAPTGLALRNPHRIIADANVRVQAAIDGQGLILADDLMRTELDGGLLLKPFQEKLNGYGYAIMCAPGRTLSAKAEKLRNWLLLP